MRACSAFAGSAMSSAYSARPLTCRCALSWAWRRDAQTPCSSSRPCGAPQRPRCAAPVRAVVLEEEPAQQLRGRLQPIRRCSARRSLERLEVLRRAPRRPLRSPPRSMARRSSALRRARRAPESPPCRRRRCARAIDASVLDLHGEGGADRGNVLVDSAWRACSWRIRPGARRGTATADEVFARARGPCAGSRDRTPRAAARRVRPPRRSSSWRPSAISSGIESPIGEPLARLPHRVPELRTGGDAKRCASSASCGIGADDRAPGVGRATRRRRSQLPRLAPRCCSELSDLAEVDDRRQLAQLLRDPQADVGAAGEQQRIRAAPSSAAASSSSVRGA